MEEDTKYLDILEKFFTMVDNGEIEGSESLGGCESLKKEKANNLSAITKLSDFG